MIGISKRPRKEATHPGAPHKLGMYLGGSFVFFQALEQN